MLSIVKTTEDNRDRHITKSGFNSGVGLSKEVAAIKIFSAEKYRFKDRPGKYT